MLWKKKNKKNRSDHLGDAGKARAKGNKKKAIALYREALQSKPDDTDALRKLAPLLAETRQYGESWNCFKTAAKSYCEAGFVEKAMSMFTQAVRYMPRNCDAWEGLARLQFERKHMGEALTTLLKGRDNFRGRRYRKEAVRLLKNAWQLKEWDYDISTDLADLLVKVKKKDHALQLLRGLVERVEGGRLRKMRGWIFRLHPRPSTLWYWLRAAMLGR